MRNQPEDNFDKGRNLLTLNINVLGGPGSVEIATTTLDGKGHSGAKHPKGRRG
jgi:hypothetical protein